MNVKTKNEKIIRDGNRQLRIEAVSRGDEKPHAYLLHLGAKKPNGGWTETKASTHSFKTLTAAEEAGLPWLEHD